MRRPALLGLFLGLALALAAHGQDDPPAKVDPLARRYGLDVVPEFYPQKAPEDALKSIVKAVDAGRLDYLLAHLTDPPFVDARVAEYMKDYPRGDDAAKRLLAFNRLIRETDQHLRNDPPLLRELRQFAKDAAWDTKEDGAVGTAKAVPARKVFLKRVGDRYFLENRQQ